MHNHAPQNYNCPFCLLANGIKNKHVESVHTDIVFYNKEVLAFVSSLQWEDNFGNVLITPKKHFENIYDLPAKYGESIQEATKTIALAMKIALSCDGISTRQHNEPDGGQDVWHYHLHITPRYKNDNYYANMKSGQLASVAKRAEYATLLRQHITRNVVR